MEHIAMSNIFCCFKKYVWCFPALIMFMGILYYINLFERMYARDLERQMNEKFQIINVLEALHTYDGLHIAVNAFDNFDDTNIYILKKNLETGQLEERYHSNNCKFKLRQHPFESDEIKHAGNRLELWTTGIKLLKEELKKHELDAEEYTDKKNLDKIVDHKKNL